MIIMRRCALALTPCPFKLRHISLFCFSLFFLTGTVLMSSMGTLYFVAFVGFLLTELYAVLPPPFALPPKPLKQQQFHRPQQQHTSGGGGGHGQKKAGDEDREQINSVVVSCHPDSLEIVIQPDLFGVGASVKSGDLRLGVDKSEQCRATVSTRDEYKIIAGLLECGTKHWMTEDSLVYTNLLIFSPEAPADGVIRMEEAVIPIECHYERKYSLSSSALAPTWIPFVSTLSSMEKLDFNLKIMTPDWVYKRSSNVFYLGEPINIEASVRLGHHLGLRVFLSMCVATLTPDEHSLPRYVFIEDGCLLDSQVPNSKSQFLQRAQDDKLYLVIDAFRFHNENRGELYITCQMTAVPVNDAEAPNKACTFVNGRWLSADSNDYLCGFCQTQNEEGHVQDKLSSPSKFSPRGFGRPAKPETLWRSGLKTDQEWDKEAKVGPLLILPTEKKTDAVFPHKVNQPQYGSSWRSGVHQETGSIEEDNEVVPEHKGLIPDLPSTLEQEDVENVTSETNEVNQDLTEDDEDDDDEEEEDDDATEDEPSELDPDIFSEKVNPDSFKAKKMQENETTTDSIDVSSNTQNTDLTTLSNTTDSGVSHTN